MKLMLAWALLLLSAWMAAGQDFRWALEAVDRTRIRENLLELTSEPHVAGSDRDEWLARWVAEKWREVGSG